MLNGAKKYLDGEKYDAPSPNTTCPFSEGCKRHYSPGDILRYSIAIALSVFLFLFIFSLFFPEIIAHPNLDILRDLVNIIHALISGAKAATSEDGILPPDVLTS